jgi:thioredoxin-like negative regulator of GroEL
MEEEFKEKVVFAVANVDSAPQSSQKYGINPIPSVILFKKGEPVSQFVGVKPESEIREWLENRLKENGN